MNGQKEDYTGYAVVVFSLLGIFLVWIAYHATPQYIVEVGAQPNITGIQTAPMVECDQKVLVYNETYHAIPGKSIHIFLVFGVKGIIPPLELKRIPIHGKLLQLSNATGLKSSGELHNEYIKYEYIPDEGFLGTDYVEYTAGTAECDGVMTEGTIGLKVLISPILTPDVLVFPPSYILPESNEERTKAVQKVFNDTKFKMSIPQQDTWLTRPRYKTCAMVSSGGSLRGSHLGSDIDSHDMVMRVNSAPTIGYEVDVGHKISIGFQSLSTNLECWKWNAEHASELPSEILGVALWADQFKKYIRCGGAASNVSLVNYQFMDLADNILAEYTNHASPKKYRSTGMEAVIACTMVCNELTLYGFNTDSAGFHHYFDHKPGEHEWAGHSFAAEKQFYHDLVAGSGPFMKYLKEYSLPKVKIASGQT